MGGHSNENGSSSSLSNESSEAIAAQLTSPTALRKLVLNYLIHHCYVDTAQAFADDGISASSSNVATHASSSSGSTQEEKRVAGTAVKSSNSVRRSVNGSNGHSRSSSRLAAAVQHSSATAHPLSAPPLSHEDSSMEVEVDNMLVVHDDTQPSTASSSKDKPITQGSTSVVGGEAEELSAEELQNVRIRKDVRDCIVAGRVRQAIELCNRHFPTVLNASLDDATGGGAKQSKGVSTSAHIRSASKENGAAASGVGNERILPANPTSLDPAHLSLNLQIQAFIEIVRAASSSNATSPTLAHSVPSASHQGASAMPSMHSIVTNTPGIAAAAISRSASPAPSSVSSTSATSANGMSGSAYSAGGSSAQPYPALHTALRHAQSLYNEVQSLPAYWRAMYLKELESVTSMLAYTDLERSPSRKYLDQSRREALAEQINSAIMLRTGKPSQPLIESAVRQTTFCWSTLADDKVAVPSSHAVFSSGAIVGVDSFDTTESHSTTAGTSSHDRAKNNKALPPFDLHTFLRER